MKVLICYFSGTGNTKRIIDRYVDSFTKGGDEVMLHSIEKGNDVDVSECDLLGLAYPVYAFNAPPIVEDFVESLPKLSVEKRAFIVNTSGEPLMLNNMATLRVKRWLKRRNIKVTNEYHYCMPYNIMFRHTDSMAYKMLDTAEKIVPLDYAELKRGEEHKFKYVPCGRFISAICRIEHWGGRYNGKKYTVSDKCIDCKMCVRMCPSHNIKYENGKFEFGDDCLMCMRCAHLCPADAIDIGIFKKWKVNGAYRFEKPIEVEVDKHKNYCKNAYKKYFDRCEKRIKEQK